MGKATVAIEDRRFYEHGGIDFQGIARAAYNDVRAGRTVEGGSTITQQLVRNLYIRHQERTPAPEARRGLPRHQAQRQAREELDPRQLHEHGLLRQPRLRRRGGRADVLLAPREQALAPPVGSPRRAAAGAVDLRPVQEPRARARAAQRRAEGAVRERRHQLRQLPGGDQGHRPAPAPGEDLQPDPRALLLQLRARRADQEVRRRDGALGWAQGLHDHRPRACSARRRRRSRTRSTTTPTPPRHSSPSTRARARSRR